MKTNLETLDNSRARLEISVDPQQWETALEKAYRKVVRQVSVRGFRKGKVPRPILERQYGESILWEEAVDFLAPEVFNEAVAELELKPIEQPQLLDVKHLDDPDNDLVIIFEVDVHPEVELGEYRGLKATRREVSVTSEQIDEVLERQQEKNREIIVVDSRTDAQVGDFAVIDFVGYKDGEPFSGGASEDYMLELGSQQFVPGFEEQIVGMHVGDSKEITVTFPENYNSEELAGREVVFHVSLKELKEKLLPELDDEFAKDLGEHETLAELRAGIEQNLIQQAEAANKKSLESELLAQLIASSTVPVPESILQHRLEFMIEDFSETLRYQGMTFDTYLQALETSKEEFQEKMRPEAVYSVKRELVLGAVSKAEGLDPSDEEIDHEIEQLSADTPDPERYRERYEERRRQIEAALRLRKAAEFLIKAAVLVEKNEEPSADESNDDLQPEE